MAERPFPAYEGDEPYFFVCYAHEDAQTVYDEMRWIVSAGFNLWYDDGIHVGTVWRRVLAEALEGAAGLIFMQTAQSVASEFCLNEVRFALDEAKPIFILQLEPSSLPAELRLSLGDRQALVRQNLTPDAFRQKLVNALTTCLAGTPTAPPAQAARGDPALALRQRRRADRDRRILLTTVSAIEGNDDADTLIQTLVGGGGELLGREGNTLFTAFDSASRALEAVNALPGSVRAGISGGDLLFEDGMFHGTPVREATELKNRAVPGQILCAQRVYELVSSPQAGASSATMTLDDGGTLEFVQCRSAQTPQQP